MAGTDLLHVHAQLQGMGDVARATAALVLETGSDGSPELQVNIANAASKIPLQQLSPSLCCPPV